MRYSNFSCFQGPDFQARRTRPYNPGVLARAGTLWLRCGSFFPSQSLFRRTSDYPACAMPNPYGSLCQKSNPSRTLFTKRSLTRSVARGKHCFRSILCNFTVSLSRNFGRGQVRLQRVLLVNVSAESTSMPCLLKCPLLNKLLCLACMTVSHYARYFIENFRSS